MRWQINETDKCYEITGLTSLGRTVITEIPKYIDPIVLRAIAHVPELMEAVEDLICGDMNMEQAGELLNEIKYG